MVDNEKKKEEEFSYRLGMRRGGEKSTKYGIKEDIKTGEKEYRAIQKGRNLFVSRAAVERYAKIFGVEAAKQRFNFKSDNSSSLPNNPDLKKYAADGGYTYPTNLPPKKESNNSDLKKYAADGGYTYPTSLPPKKESNNSDLKKYTADGGYTYPSTISKSHVTTDFDDEHKNKLTREAEKYAHENEKLAEENKKFKRDNYQEEWKFRKEKHMGWIFIILALLLHLFKYSLNFYVGITWVFDVLFAVFIYIVVFTNQDRNAKGLRALGIILFLEVLLLFIIGYIDFLFENKYVQYYLLNRILTPWWFYFAIIWANDCEKPHWGAKLFKFGVIVFWIVVLLTIPAVSFANMEIPNFVTMQTNEITMDLYDRTKYFWSEQIPDILQKSYNNIRQAWGRQMNIATGGYYVGTVDKHQNEQLGVHIESIRPTAPEFTTDSLVSVNARLKVLSLDDGIKVNVSCYTGTRGKNNFAKASKIFPSTPTVYYNLEREDINCLFDPGMFSRDYHKITIAADFNFETMAYVKSYFMDNERMRALISQGKDPLGEFGIKDKNPKAIFTNGPIMIGMKISEGLIGIENYGQRDYSFGITIEPNTGWDGYIKKLNEFLIMVPDSIKLYVDSCNVKFNELEESNYQELCVAGYKKYYSRQLNVCLDDANIPRNHYNYDNATFYDNALVADKISKFEECLRRTCKEETEGYNIYSLNISRNPADFEDIKEFKTFTCRIGIEDKEKVLGNTPVATHYFLAKARYDYVIEKDVTVNVRQGNEKQTATTNAQAIYDVSKYHDLVIKTIALVDKSMNNIPNIDSKSLLSDCIINSIMQIESKGNPDAVSYANARGLMQITKIAEEDISKNIIDYPDLKNYMSQIGLENEFNPFNPEHNLLYGIFYFAERLVNSNNKLKDNGDFNKLSSQRQREELLSYALAEYNAGPSRVNTFCRVQNNKYSLITNCFSKLPTETQDYVKKVLNVNSDCEQGKVSFIPSIKPEIDSKVLEFKKEIPFFIKSEDIEECKKNAYVDDKLIDLLKQNFVFKYDDLKLMEVINQIVPTQIINDNNNIDNDRLIKNIQTNFTIIKNCIFSRKGFYINEGFDIELDQTNYVINLSNDNLKLISNLVDNNNYSFALRNVELIYNNLLTVSLFNISTHPRINQREDKFQNFGKNPFILVNLEKKKNENVLILSGKYYNNFIINTDNFDITRDYIYTFELNNNDLLLSYSSSDSYKKILSLTFNGIEVCNFDLMHTFVNHLCEFEKDKNEFIGLIIKNKEYNSGIISSDITLQIEYDPNYKHTCCINPKFCEPPKNVNYHLATCDLELSKIMGCKITKMSIRGVNTFFCDYT
jgi:hypothetical protein